MMEYRGHYRYYHGFPGQRMLILPFSLVERMGQDALFRDFYVHSMGHFPNAHSQYTERPVGCPEYQIIYCTSGKGICMLGNEEFTVSQNQMFIFPPNEPHFYEADKDDPWSYYWVHFKGEKAAFMASGFERPVDVSHNFEHRIALFDEAYNILKAGCSNENLLHACFTLGHFISSFKVLNEPVPTSEVKNENEFATSVTNWTTHFMNTHIDKSIKLKDLSAFTRYSPQHLNRLFLKETGYAPMTYFRHLKIERACYYLKNGNYTVSQVARILGLKDSGHFSRLFSKIKKVSPSVYQKVEQQKSN